MDTFPYKFVLAPMAELSTAALRSTIKDFSPDILVYSEMLSAGAVAAQSRHSDSMIEKHPHDDPIVYQILGNSPATMARACSILSAKGCFSVDINMGCAAPDILKKRQGAFLLNDIKITEAVVRACRKATRTRLSAKIRTGFNAFVMKDVIDFVTMLEACGIDFITVHPRFAKLGFRRTADWHIIDNIINTVSIPVIGNGDISSPSEALNKMERHGCAAVMIGRKAATMPWIFRLCADLIEKNDNLLEINCEEVFTTTLEKIKKYLPVNLHKSRGHRFCFYFSKNVLFGHKLFSQIRAVDTIEAMTTMVRDYYSRNPHERIIRYSRGERTH